MVPSSGDADVHLDPEAIAERQFPTARKGYEPQAVRAFLTAVAESQRAIVARLEAAEREAQSVLDGAEARRAEVLREAQDEAKRQLAAIAAERDRTLGDAVAAAEAERDAILAAAQAEVDALLGEARAARQRVLDDLRRRRKAARTQVEQLHAARERLLTALAAVRSDIDATTLGLRDALPEAKKAADAAARRVELEPEASIEQLEGDIQALRLAGLTFGGPTAADVEVDGGSDAVAEAGGSDAGDAAASGGPAPIPAGPPPTEPAAPERRSSAVRIVRPLRAQDPVTGLPEGELHPVDAPDPVEEVRLVAREGAADPGAPSPVDLLGPGAGPEHLAPGGFDRPVPAWPAPTTDEAEIEAAAEVDVEAEPDDEPVVDEPVVDVEPADDAVGQASVGAGREPDDEPVAEASVGAGPHDGAVGQADAPGEEAVGGAAVRAEGHDDAKAAAADGVTSDDVTGEPDAVVDVDPDIDPTPDGTDEGASSADVVPEAGVEGDPGDAVADAGDGAIAEAGDDGEPGDETAGDLSAAADVDPGATGSDDADAEHPAAERVTDTVVPAAAAAPDEATGARRNGVGHGARANGLGLPPAGNDDDQLAEDDDAAPTEAEDRPPVAEHRPTGEGEAAAAGESGAPTRPSPDAVDALFARLRSARTERVAGAEAVLAGPADEPTVGADATGDEPGAPEEETSVEVVGDAVAALVSIDDVAVHRGGGADREALLARRDALVDPVAAALTRRLKRLLADEQNEVLDALRRTGVAEAVPDPVEHLGRWAHTAGPELAEAAAAGARFAAGDDVVPPSPGDLADIADALAGSLARPLLERLARVVEAAEGDAEHAAAGVRSTYRTWRADRIAAAAEHAALDAFSLGVAVASGPGTDLCWVVDDGAAPSPDCEDNALAGPVPNGEPFPTGHHRPPAHPGCRCILVPPSDS